MVSGACEVRTVSTSEEDAMSFSRREFVRTFGLGGTGAGAFVSARGREALVGEFGVAALQGQAPQGMQDMMRMMDDPEVIRISSNENPMGPGPAAYKAMVATLDGSNRYPMNASPSMVDLRTLLGKKYGAKVDNVILGDGSGEILDNAVRAFTSPTRALVNASPSYLSPEQTATKIGTPIKHVPLTADLKIDLGAMAAASKGAGLVFLCNPNNPTATAHTQKDIAAFVAEVRKISPTTAILIDEAYIDYATAPGVGTSVAVALANPRVFVARTFSKAFGMAGLRLGYTVGQIETIKKLDEYTMPYNANVMGLAAAVASVNDPAQLAQEVKRNQAARQFTMDWFNKNGFKSTDSQSNFLFVNIGRPAAAFRDGCRASKVLVGRDFPPMEKTHARISIGTMDEMKKAVGVFAKVLGASATTA
jgi:histidinol-phosphate aminotransferase